MKERRPKYGKRGSRAASDCGRSEIDDEQDSKISAPSYSYEGEDEVAMDPKQADVLRESAASSVWAPMSEAAVRRGSKEGERGYDTSDSSPNLISAVNLKEGGGFVRM